MMNFARKIVDSFGSLIQNAELSEDDNSAEGTVLVSCSKEDFCKQMKKLFKNKKYQCLSSTNVKGKHKIRFSLKPNDCIKQKIYADANDVNQRNELMHLRNGFKVAEFRNMNIKMAEKLLILDGGIDIDFKASKAPSQSKFIQWMQKHNEFLASGFVTGAERKDCGVYIDSLEGIIDKDNTVLVNEFKNIFNDADGIAEAEEKNKIRICCWYD